MAPLLHFSGIKETVYTLVPSLQCIAASEIVVTLWNRNDVRVLLHEFKSNMKFDALKEQRLHEDKWEIIIEKVENYAKQLQLPKMLKKKVKGIITPVADEILQWKKYHEARFKQSTVCHYHRLPVVYHRFVYMPVQFCWTVFGTIDRKRTAEAIAKDQNACIDIRYKFACTYCLESDIAKLWKKLPKYYKRDFANSSWRTKWLQSDYLDETDNWQSLQTFWSCVMAGGGVLENIIEPNDYISLGEFLMEQLHFDNNINAMKYFFSKYPEVKNQCVKAIAFEFDTFCPRVEFLTETRFFLLSLLDESQQAKLKLDWYAGRILSDCLYWPRQDLFMPLANCLWSFLSGGSFYCVLICINDRVRCFYKDYNYQELFTEFWKLSTEPLKQFVIRQCESDVELLLKLYEAGDKRNIEIILQHATIKERNNVIACCNNSLHESIHGSSDELDNSSSDESSCYEPGDESCDELDDSSDFMRDDETLEGLVLFLEELSNAKHRRVN